MDIEQQYRIVKINSNTLELIDKTTGYNAGFFGLDGLPKYGQRSPLSSAEVLRVAGAKPLILI